MLFEIGVIPHLGIQLRTETTPFLSRGRAGNFKHGQWCGNANLLFCCSGVSRVPGGNDSERSVIQLLEEC